jgi:two-component system nitrogen regulation sensor histidine kinase NtrY
VPMEKPREERSKKGSRIIGGIIVLLVILFLVIDVFIRQSSEFSPGRVTNLLLTALQFIVLLLALILFFVLGRNLVKLYFERRRKVPGAHFKTKLVIFFSALSFIPTLLLFFFASDLINRNIAQWFQMDLAALVDNTRAVAEEYYASASETTLHFAQELSREIRRQDLLAPGRRPQLEAFIRTKLDEYKLDEISLFLGEEELFSFINPNLPFQDYQDLPSDAIRRAHLGLTLSDIKPMGTGEFIRRGVSFNVSKMGDFLVTAGTFLTTNTAQNIKTILSYSDRYRTRKTQQALAKSLYKMILVFVTLIIVFVATWIGFHIAKAITVPIEKLAQATKEVSRGNLDVQIEDPASDEIGTLIDSFNQMTSDLRTGRDAVAQKTAEVAARQRYIETVLNTITTGVVALDERGGVTTVNPAGREMLALADRDVIGKSYQEVLAHRRYDELRQAIDGALKTRARFNDRAIQLGLDGQTTTLALTVTPLRQAGREFSGLIVALDNLTQLIKAQKIAAWKEVAQRVAHEIKNPLTPIQLNAERILRNLRKAEGGAGEALEEGARTILQEAQTIKSLVDEFSDFARLPKINLQPTSLPDIIRQVVAMFRGIFAEVRFDLVFDEALPPTLPLDPEQMKRVFINLIGNAIDAMNKKGAITIRATLDPAQHLVRVEVTDTGPGIPAEDQEKLFLPHFSTKKKGTGLGLSIVNQIVKEHKGTVSAQNIKPTGAQFTIELPT